MFWKVLLILVLGVSTAAAENLIVNSNFDLDPTDPANGWVASGTGSFSWNQSSGDPALPSARTDQTGDESMVLYQCIAVTGGMTVDFSARSFTHASVGAATNGVTFSVYANDDCTGEPIETVATTTTTFPSWALRERLGYVIPANALSARIELSSAANGNQNYISWDDVIVSTPSVPVDGEDWGGVKALFR
jgi:hypothetical protein